MDSPTLGEDQWKPRSSSRAGQGLPGRHVVGLAGFIGVNTDQEETIPFAIEVLSICTAIVAASQETFSDSLADSREKSANTHQTFR
jgi:hypothetical protein